MQATATLSKLEQQGAHALSTTAVSLVLGLVLSVILARTLGPTGKGTLDLVSVTASLFTLVLGVSLNASITHHVARHGQMPAGLVRQLAFWATAAGGVTAVCLAFQTEFAIRLGLLPPSDSRFWIAFIAITVVLGIWAGGVRGIVIGQHRIVVANRIDVGVKAALLVAYSALAMGTVAAGPKPYAVAGVAAAAVLITALLLAFRGPTVSMPGTWSALLAIAAPVHGTNILHFLNQRADLFFVQAFHGATEVGLYALAVGLAQCVLLISSALAQPLLPQVSAARSTTDAAASTAQTCRTFIALGLVGSVLLAGCGWWLLAAVFGTDFAGSIPALLILLPGMIGFGLTNIFIAHFVGIGRSRVNLWISVIVLLVTIAGNLTLTRAHGAIGAATTSTAAYGLAGGLSLWLFQRHASPSVAAIWPTSGDWRRIGATIAAFRL